MQATVRETEGEIMDYSVKLLPGSRVLIFVGLVVVWDLLSALCRNVCGLCSY
jgi:hypothetical protein